MSPDTEAWQKLDVAMQSLWRLGIIAVHDTGNARGEGIRTCRKLYEEAGGKESGHLGFCHYRATDAEAAVTNGCLEIWCGDFLDKSLVTRNVQEVVRDTLRAAGLHASARRGTANRITLRGLQGGRPAPPSPPPLHVTPRPPDALIAATTAVPARSLPYKRSLLTPGVVPESPLDRLTDLALGMGTPVRIPDAPGTEMPGAQRRSPGGPTGRRPPPVRLTRDVLRAAGVGVLVAGVALTVLLWNTEQTWIGGVVFMALGALLVILGRRGRRR